MTATKLQTLLLSILIFKRSFFSWFSTAKSHHPNVLSEAGKMLKCTYKHAHTHARLSQVYTVSSCYTFTVILAHNLKEMTWQKVKLSFLLLMSV